MLPERLRVVTLLLGAVAAAGLAEQHHHPADIIAAIPGARWPNDDVNVWTVVFAGCSIACLIAAVSWPTRPRPMRAAAILLATSIAARGVGIFMVYGFDLWGTVAGLLLTSSLIVSSWSWSGSTLRSIPEDVS